MSKQKTDVSNEKIPTWLKVVGIIVGLGAAVIAMGASSSGNTYSEERYTSDEDRWQKYE